MVGSRFAPGLLRSRGGEATQNRIPHPEKAIVMNRVIRLALVAIGGLSVASPAHPADANPKVWAVVIGVDRYEDGLIPSCEGSARDARSVADWVEHSAQWERKNVLRLDDRGKRKHGAPAELGAYLQPTLENLEWAVVDWLGHRVEKDDIVVIYFAGQAIAKAPLPGEATGRAYLLPIDARGGDVARHRLVARRLARQGEVALRQEAEGRDLARHLAPRPREGRAAAREGCVFGARLAHGLDPLARRVRLARRRQRPPRPR